MASKKSNSPLRYPGGKACLTDFITNLVERNNLTGGTYLELYAGGAGAALNLLFNKVFDRIHINDFDYHVYCIWDSILNDTENFIRLINDTPITIAEWHRQQIIFKQGRNVDNLSLGFATFFLNRTNRSGIIFKAGPIGGLNQEGNYLIDVRFNKSDLIKRIIKIADYGNSIILTNHDAVEIINNIGGFEYNLDDLFIYLDPPYYNKGKQLYLNNYAHDNHLVLATSVENSLHNLRWLISYDNVEPIKKMYNRFRMSTFDLNYTLQSKKFGSELLVFSDNLDLPDSITVNNRNNLLTLI
jgi:DNA adenine methylase